MDRELIKEPKLWRIYMIRASQKDKNKKFYGQTDILYTGITLDFGRRMGDYLYGRGKRGFLNSKLGWARKIPVYIEYFYGSEFETMQRENIIKKYKRERKEALIKSDNNMLVGYKHTRHVILKEHLGQGEIVEAVR